MWYVCINMYKRVCTVNVNITFVITVRVIISDNNDTVIIDPCNIFLSCIPSIMYIHTVHCVYTITCTDDKLITQ